MILIPYICMKNWMGRIYNVKFLFSISLCAPTEYRIHGGEWGSTFTIWCKPCGSLYAIRDRENAKTGFHRDEELCASSTQHPA